MTFFECQTELPQPFPEAADADLHIVFRQEPGLQFGKRRIGFAHNAGTKSFVIRSKLRLGAAPTRARRASSYEASFGLGLPRDGRSSLPSSSNVPELCRYRTR